MSTPPHRISVLAALAAFPAVALAAAAMAQQTTAATPGWTEVGTLFAERCTLCHAGEFAPLGLDLRTYESALAGGSNGAVLIAGDPDASELVRRIRGESQPRMPLDGPPFLDDARIEMIVAWVRAGMPEGAATQADPTTDPVAEPAPAAGQETDSGQSSLPDPDEPVLFSDVEPIFKQRCIQCHSDNGILGFVPEGLRLDSYENILAGGDRIVVIPGNPGFSEILRRVVGLAEPRMPLDGPPWLSEEHIALLERWVVDGARAAAGEAAPIHTGGRIRTEGILTGPAAIDGFDFVIGSNAPVEDLPGIGGLVELRGTVRDDGDVIAERLRGR